MTTISAATPASPNGAVGIRLHSLTKVYPGSSRPAVDSLDLDIPAGELVALVGPSGCGKTTTLKMINRLIEPTSGRIDIGGEPALGRPVHQLRRTIGMVIQQVGLFPHRTIADNIATVPKLLDWDQARIRARVEELTTLVGLDHDLLGRYPGALSGGQQQRVGVARALAADPPVLLMDEPYSAVDPIVRARLQDDLLAIQARLHKTIVFVTHDIDEAIKLADRIAVLDVGGVLVQVAPPAELLADPATEFVADFLGSDRGLKRLALLTVADVAPERGPVVADGSTAAEATAVMDAHHVDWVGVCDGDRLLGWLWRSDVERAGRVEGRRAETFRAVVAPDTSLRTVLDGIVTSLTNVAVVVDGDRYVGMISVGAVSAGVRVG